MDCGQSGVVVGNQVLYNQGTGLVSTLDARTGDPSVVLQTLGVDANRLDGNGVGLGFAVVAHGSSVSYFAQGAWSMESNTIQHNVGAGSLGVQGSYARQSVDMYPGHNTITSNGLIRFAIYANAGLQAVFLLNGTNGNTMNGANLITSVGGANQAVFP